MLDPISVTRLAAIRSNEMINGPKGRAEEYQLLRPFKADPQERLARLVSRLGALFVATRRKPQAAPC